MKVVRRGNVWLLVNSAGDQILGTHATKEAAEAQLINMNNKERLRNG